MITEENVVIAPEQGTTPFTTLSDDVCVEHAFLHFAPQDILISSDW